MTMQNLNTENKETTEKMIFGRYELARSANSGNLFSFLQDEDLDLMSAGRVYFEGTKTVSHGYETYDVTKAVVMPSLSKEDENMAYTLANQCDDTAMAAWADMRESSVDTDDFLDTHGHLIDMPELRHISKSIQRGTKRMMHNILAKIEKSAKFSAIDKAIFSTILNEVAQDSEFWGVL